MAYGGGPADWAAMQQQQRQQQMNNLVQMFMAMKQYQNEQGWKQKEWENQLQQQQWSRPLEERRVKAYETMAGASGQSDFDARFRIGKGMGMDDIQATAFARGEKTPDQIKEEARARAEGTAAGTPEKEPKLTPYQQFETNRQKQADVDKKQKEQWERDRAYVDQSRTILQKEVEALYKNMDKLAEDKKADQQFNIDQLETAISNIDVIKSGIEAGSTPLNYADRAEIKKIMANKAKIKVGKFDVSAISGPVVGGQVGQNIGAPPSVPSATTGKGGYPSMKRSDLPAGTAIKKLPTGEFAARVNGVIYIVEQ